jgi:hypothetical protein
MASAGASFGQVAISVTIAPPPLPMYEQPLCPGEDYIWIPGYWAWDLVDEDYYWVPGTWVLPPEVGLLWTPPYWAWVNPGFVFYDEAGSGPSAPGALGANAARMQEFEQRHQQQTIQLQQRHDMESQRLQTRLQAANPAQPRPPSRPR